MPKEEEEEEEEAEAVVAAAAAACWHMWRSQRKTRVTCPPFMLKQA
jgi:hypothetical protein